MLEEKITKKRKELDESIEKNGNYDDVYKLSVELDDLITEFYKDSIKRKNKRERRIIKHQHRINKILYIA